MLKTRAFQIADFISVKEFKKEFTGNLLYFNSDELFYEIDQNKFVYIFEYGVVCFFGYDETEMTNFLNMISNYCEYALENRMSEDFLIEINKETNKVLHNKIILNEINSEIIRLIMHNVSQSVALDYFSQQAENLFKDTQYYTLQLEINGKLNIQGKRLKKFIGKSLNLKNRISQHLYIFDSHPETWENEEFDQTDKSMKKAFDMYDRSKNLKEDIEIIKDNLELFIDIMHHRKSSFLEWIIIALILVEVLNMLFEKLL